MHDTCFEKEFKPLMTRSNDINLDPLKNADTF